MVMYIEIKVGFSSYQYSPLLFQPYSNLPEQQDPSSVATTTSADSASNNVEEMGNGGEWKQMAVGQRESARSTTSQKSKGKQSFCESSWGRRWTLTTAHIPILLISVLVFCVLCGAGISIYLVFVESEEDNTRAEALELSTETGAWFSDQLDKAILPLFSIAQFATELEIFADLPGKIGEAGEAGSLPFLPNADGTGLSSHRNVTGVCDQPELASRFVGISSAIKKNAKMEGVLVNLQLAPQGVICLLHPMNNTEDFKNGTFLDSTGAWGLDLLNSPEMSFIARAAIPTEEVSIAGPRQLTQCPECDPFFIARLPIQSEKNEIKIDGVAYPRWGFATALINWTELVKRSDVHENFEKRGFAFRLTRTDRNYNPDTDTYDKDVVVLAESANYKIHRGKGLEVTTALQTTNNEWEISVVNSDADINRWTALVIVMCSLISAFVAYLVYTVLLQKQSHTAMLGKTLAQEAKVETERNMTAYFAHELRNPLSAIDSALASMPEDLPENAQTLVSSMQVCSSFMSCIMNNLLDVRKIEEGKMHLHSRPLSLSQLVQDVYQMTLPALKPGVELKVMANTQDRDWVLGDTHRIQQILTNVVSNATKYTLCGSVTIVAGWEGPNVKLECIDTGPGIPKNEQEKLFERFVMRGGAPGTGLGLAIAKQLVDLIGGSIRFDSDPTVKSGTTCIVLLPLDVCQQPQEELSKPSDTEPIEEPLSILIIDDIKMNRMMLKRRLQKGVAPNSMVTEVATGEEALELCQTQNFDVMIVDQYMEEAGGVMVGTDVVIAMRRMKIDSIIIGCSGNDLEDLFSAAGTDWVWQKPMPSNSKMVQQLRQALLTKKL